MAVGHLAMILLILFAASLDDSTATTTVAATVAGGGTSNVTFRSRKTTYTPDLGDPSSPGFQARASTINTQLHPILQEKLRYYETMTVVSFRNGSGSVVNDLRLRFVTAVPDHTEIAWVLVDASSKVTGFDIETTTITVDNIVSGGANHKISLLSSLCLLLLSWLLSSKQ